MTREQTPENVGGVVSPCRSCTVCLYAEASFIKYLSPQERADLDRHKICRFFAKGELLFCAGSVPQYLFCIRSGKVKVFSQDEYGRMQIIQLALQQQMVGYQPLITHECYEFSAMAMEDTHVCLIEKSYFTFLLHHHIEILIDMTKKISHELAQTQQRVISLAQKNIRERVAEFLLWLGRVYGVESDGKTLRMRLSRQEIANYVGTSVESVIRILSEFNQEGMVRICQKKLAIQDPSSLARVANMHRRAVATSPIL